MTYKKIVTYNYQQNSAEYLKDSTDYHCRFCNEQKNKTDFRMKAHAVSEFLGNKTLRTKYECDKCNEIFSQIEENELGKLLLNYKAMRGLKGKRGKTQLKNLNADYNEETKVLNISLHDKFICIGSDKFKCNSPITFVKSNKIIVNGRLIYRAFLKYILSIVPENLLMNFERAFKILKDDDKKTLFMLGIIYHQKINREYSISLCENIFPENGLPKYIGFIDVFGMTFVIFLEYDNTNNYFPPSIVCNLLKSENNINEAQLINFSSEELELVQAELISGNLSKFSFLD